MAAVVLIICLHLSVTWGSLMDPSQLYQSIPRAATPPVRLGARKRGRRCAVAMLPPRPLPPALLTLFLSPCSHTLSFSVPSSLPPAVSALSEGDSSQPRMLETLPANVSVCCLPGPWGKGLEMQRRRSSGSKGKPLFLTARLLHFLMGKLPLRGTEFMSL